MKRPWWWDWSRFRAMIMWSPALVLRCRACGSRRGVRCRGRRGRFASTCEERRDTAKRFSTRLRCGVCRQRTTHYTLCRMPGPFHFHVLCEGCNEALIAGADGRTPCPRSDEAQRVFDAHLAMKALAK